MGTVNVWLVQGTSRSILTTKSFDHGADVWFESGAFIGAQKSFSVEIEGVVGDSYRSDLALDDVAFRHCSGEKPVHSRETFQISPNTYEYALRTE